MITAWWLKIHTRSPSYRSSTSRSRLRTRSATSHQLSPEGGR